MTKIFVIAAAAASLVAAPALAQSTMSNNMTGSMPAKHKTMAKKKTKKMSHKSTKSMSGNSMSGNMMSNSTGA